MWEKGKKGQSSVLGPPAQVIGIILLIVALLLVLYFVISGRFIEILKSKYT